MKVEAAEAVDEVVEVEVVGVVEVEADIEIDRQTHRCQIVERD